MSPKLRCCPSRKDLVEGEAGSALIEQAASLSVLFGLLFCFMEICMAFYTQDLISEAARSGTHYAMVHGATCLTSTGSSCTLTNTAINTYVNGVVTPNIAAGTFVATTTYPNGNENVGSNVQVQVVYTFKITLPFVPSTGITLTSTSKAPILR